MLFDLDDLCRLDAIVDRRRVQSGFSIGISGIDSCLVLYQHLQATTRNQRTTSLNTVQPIRSPALPQRRVGRRRQRPRAAKSSLLSAEVWICRLRKWR